MPCPLNMSFGPCTMLTLLVNITAPDMPKFEDKKDLFLSFQKPDINDNNYGISFVDVIFTRKKTFVPALVKANFNYWYICKSSINLSLFLCRYDYVHCSSPFLNVYYSTINIQ